MEHAILCKPMKNVDEKPRVKYCKQKIVIEWLTAIVYVRSRLYHSCEDAKYPSTLILVVFYDKQGVTRAKSTLE